MGKLSITLLTLSNDLNDFHEGNSLGIYPRYYIGTAENYKFWRNWIPDDLFKMIVTKYLNGEKLDEIIDTALLSENDIKRKILIRYLLNNTENIWQWKNNKRFFVHGNYICFTNGVKFGEYTERRKVF